MPSFLFGTAITNPSTYDMGFSSRGSRRRFVTGRAALRYRLFGELVEILDEREHRAVVPLHARVRRLDHVVLVRRVSAAPVAQTEMTRGELERLAREHVPRIGARVPRP